MADGTEVRTHNPATAYEPEDWPIGKIGLIYAAILILLVITPFILIAGYPSAVPDASRKLLVTPPAPVLQVDPQRDLANFRLKEDRRLNTYYWVDKQKGIVHIPIGEAIKKLAQSGIAGFPQGQP